MAPGGAAVVEFGEGMGDDVCTLMNAAGMTPMERCKDLAGTERCAAFKSYRSLSSSAPETSVKNGGTR
jgi:hypothetical protein